MNELSNEEDKVRKQIGKIDEVFYNNKFTVFCRDGSILIKNWKSNGWKTAKKQPVKNKELWVTLDNLVSEHDITWKWIKGHSGHPENERADELANEAIISKG